MAQNNPAQWTAEHFTEESAAHQTAPGTVQTPDDRTANRRQFAPWDDILKALIFSRGFRMGINSCLL